MKNVGTKNKNKVRRRAFLKGAGLTSLLAGLFLSKTLKACERPDSESDTKTLDEQIAKLSDEEKATLTWLLLTLREHEPPLELTAPAGAGCFVGMAIVQKESEREAKQEAKLNEERRQRNSLSGQEKVDFIVELIKDRFGVRGDNTIYVASHHRKVLSLIANDDLGSADKLEIAFFNRVNECFDGCSKRVRQQAISQYLNEVLPPLEASEQEEDAHEAAVDGLLDLVANRNTEQIAAMTAQMKAMAV